MKAKDTLSTVISNIPLNERFFILKCKNKFLAKNAKPGNFIMVKPQNQTDPLLRRPFGIMNVNRAEQSISIYYEVIGKATSFLSRQKEGDILQILGPLGNSFENFSNKNILFVAGGRGIAPLYYTMTGLQKTNKIYLLYGAKSSTELNLLDQLKELNIKKSFFYTDDGSCGSKGLLTSNIGKIIKEHKIEITLSCGPEAMFNTLKNNIPNLAGKNYVSTEAYMGCGFGVCHSCVVLTDTGYQKACSDGPVFNLENYKC